MADQTIENAQSGSYDEPVLQYTLYVDGTWGRKRKRDFKGFPMFRVHRDEGRPDEARFDQEIAAKIAEIGVKPGSVCTLEERRMTLEHRVEDGRKYTLQRMMVMDFTNLRVWTHQ